MASLLLIVACAMSKYADTGVRESKNGQVLRSSFMDQNGLLSLHLKCTPILYAPIQLEPRC